MRDDSTSLAMCVNGVSEMRMQPKGIFQIGTESGHTCRENWWLFTNSISLPQVWCKGIFIDGKNTRHVSISHTMIISIADCIISSR